MSAEILLGSGAGFFDTGLSGWLGNVKEVEEVEDVEKIEEVEGPAACQEPSEDLIAPSVFLSFVSIPPTRFVVALEKNRKLSGCSAPFFIGPKLMLSSDDEYMLDHSLLSEAVGG